MQVQPNDFNNSYTDFSTYDNKTQWIEFTGNIPKAIAKPNWGNRIINHIKCMLGLGDGPAKVAAKIEQFLRDNINYMSAKHIAGIENMRSKLYEVMTPATRTAFSKLISDVAIKVDGDNIAARQQLIDANNVQMDRAQAHIDKVDADNSGFAVDNNNLGEELEKTKAELEQTKAELQQAKSDIAIHNLSTKGAALGDDDSSRPVRIPRKPKPIQGTAYG